MFLISYRMYQRRGPRSRGTGTPRSDGSSDRERTASQSERTASQPERTPSQLPDPSIAMSRRTTTLLSAGWSLRGGTSSRQSSGREDTPSCSQQLFRSGPRSEIPRSEIPPPRMPEIHLPPPRASPQPSDAESAPAPQVPSDLFLPVVIPAIPPVDDNGVCQWPATAEFLRPDQAYVFEEWDHPERLRAARHFRKNVDEASSSGK